MITESPIYKNIVKQSDKIMKELGVSNLEEAIAILKKRAEVSNATD